MGVGILWESCRAETEYNWVLIARVLVVCKAASTRLQRETGGWPMTEYMVEVRLLRIASGQKQRQDLVV
jgi:hypothetical protein